MNSPQLIDIITQSLNLGKINKALLVVSLVQAIMLNESIKPYRLARSIPGFRSEKLESKAKRIRQLLEGEELTDFVAYATYILKLFGLKDVCLAMDRTNWEHGSKSINFLILSAVWQNISIPLYWIALDNKGGNSDSEARIALIKWFADNFGADRINVVLADREFPSEDFYDWLKLNKIEGLFRSRENVKASDGSRRLLLSEIYKDLKLGTQKIEEFVRRLYDSRLYVAVKRIKNTDKNKKDKDTELVILVSTSKFEVDPFIQYKNRWTIEVMFNKFKTPGFNLESTSVTKLNRLSGILMLLSLAYCFSCYAGAIRRKIVAINNKGKTNRWNAYSIFRYGLDLIKHVMFVQPIASLRDKLWGILSNRNRLRPGSGLYSLIKSI